MPRSTVLVKFDGDVPSDVQGRAMMIFESALCRLTGRTVEVFKETMGDDSKLRVSMTPEERDQL